MPAKPFIVPAKLVTDLANTCLVVAYGAPPPFFCIQYQSVMQTYEDSVISLAACSFKFSFVAHDYAMMSKWNMPMIFW